MRWILLCLILCSCDPAPPEAFQGVEMTIPYRILVAGKNRDEIQEKIDGVFAKVNATFNNWNPNSEVSQLNRLEAYEKRAISREMVAFLETADRLVKMTDYRFDPTVGALQKLWMKRLAEGKVVEGKRIEELKASIGWEKLHIEEGLFWKECNETELDFGGIAKGLAVDLLVEELNKAGYGDVYVEWGGEIRTSGKHPEGRPWRISIRRPGAGSICTLELKDQAIATSGDYLQNWTVAGVTYTHILDPRTGVPLVGSIASTSVVAPTVMEADVLATALMLFGSREEAQEWAEQMRIEAPELHFWIVSR